jgi:L-methionine (R)-S-oxide reductase
MYKELIATASILVKDNPTQVSVLANISALLYQEIPDLNWVGFYLLSGETLYLGPFQGKTATTTIPITRGVCGAAARALTIQNISDVHAHPDHIACDERSNSELVIPVILQGTLFGVLDIDSPIINRFDANLEAACIKIVEIITESIDNIPFLK